MGLIGTSAVLAALQLAAAPPARAPDPSFAATIAALSEPGGVFFSDNLVSNETSYLHVVPALERLVAPGGAYLGVGPEQNFSYIARTRPAVAFIVDIRRDNLLLHLLLKATFEGAATRLEYLCLLYARPCPADPAPWRHRPLAELVRYIDGQALDTTFRRTSEAGLLGLVAGFGVPLTPDDVATIRRLHDEFVTDGLDLRFSAFGRRPMMNFPTIRQLYLERDLAGRERSFLADDDGYQVVRQLQLTDRIIPVVGDLAGTTAVAAVGRWLAERRIPVGLFYLSNVEFYLLRGGTFDRFVANLRQLPTGPTSLLTRSYFAVQTGMPHPDQQGDHLSVPLLQYVDRFFEVVGADPADLTYWRLMTEGMIPLGQAGR